MSVSVDQSNCNSYSVEWVTDAEGLTKSTNSDEIQFIEALLEIKPGAVMTFDTSLPYFGSVFLKIKTFNADVFNVIEVSVLVCADLSVSTTDSSNPIFNILRSQALTSTFEDFEITDLFEASNAVIPAGNCPITQIKLCDDTSCTNDLGATDAGLRVVNETGSLKVGVDLAVARIPALVI